MPEIMPFGKHSGKSVEQIALKDYEYFDHVLNNIPIKKYSLDRRFKFVEHVANNFVSQVKCGKDGCQNRANFISVYCGYNGYRGSSIDFAYCSNECFDRDSKVASEKGQLVSIRFDSALANTRGDTNDLVEVMARCMGLDFSKRHTKEYLEDFFNRCQLRAPYNPRRTETLNAAVSQAATKFW